jgi:hypothetical protein
MTPVAVCNSNSNKKSNLKFQGFAGFARVPPGFPQGSGGVRAGFPGARGRRTWAARTPRDWITYRFIHIFLRFSFFAELTGQGHPRRAKPGMTPDGFEFRI